MSDVNSMVDDFVNGVMSSEANLDFTLTQAQLDKIKNAFKPVAFEEHLRFEFQNDGTITVSSFDKGITSHVKLSTVDMDLKGEAYQCFYFEIKRINKLADVCPGQIKFTVANGEMKAKIGTTDLHISLPMYEFNTDVSFTMQNDEVLTSDQVSQLTSRLQASKGSGTFLLQTMELGSVWKYGTTQNVSLVSGGFKSGLSINVRPEFLDYISSITFTKEDITFAAGQDNDGTPMLMVSSDNVCYKAPIQDAQFEDVEALFQMPTDCEVTYNTLETIQKLGVLSIPLIGVENASFTMKVSDEVKGKISIVATDDANRQSYDEWQILNQKGEFEAAIGIQSYLNTVNAMSKENVKLTSKESAIILEDEVQKTILIKYM